MSHLDRSQQKGAGKEYYTNLCFKAINQVRRSPHP